MKRLIPLCLLLLISLGVVLQAQAGPTETVLSWVLSQVDDSLPGSLSYERLEASLGGPVILEGVRYEDDAMLVAVKRFELAVDVAVFSRSVTLNRLQAFDVTVHLPPPTTALPQPDSEPFALSDISLPISLDVQQVAVRNLSILPYGADQPIQVDQINLSARTEEDTLRIETAELKAPQGEVSVSGTLTPVGQYPADLSLQWRWEQDGLGRYSGRGSIKGDLSDLRILQVVSGDLRGELQASVSDPLGSPHWSVKLNALLADLGVLQADYQGQTLRVALDSSGSLDDYQASGSLTSGDLPEVGVVSATFELSGGTDVLKLPFLRLSSSASPLQLDLSADIDLGSQLLDARGSWQDLAWPLSGTPQVALPAGDLQLSGTLDDFSFALQSRLEGEAFGRLQILAEGQGDQQQIHLDTLRLNAAEGPLELAMNATLGLTDQRFDLRGNWSSIAIPLVGEPQVQIPSGNLHARGTPADYQADLETRILGDALGTLLVALRVVGNEQVATLEQLAISRPDDALAIGVTGRFEIATQQFQADLQVAELPLPLVGEAAIRIPTASLSASGTPAAYQTRLEADLSGPAVGTLQALLEANGNDLAIELQTLRLSRPDSDLAVDLGGRYRLRDQRFALQGDITALGVPLVGEPALTIPSGELQLSGTPADYQATLSLNLEGAATGELQALIEASGDAQGAVLQTLRVSRPDSELLVALDGRFGFADQQFMLGGEINALPLPLSGEPALRIPTGSLVASGTPANYQARLELGLSGEATGELQALIQASGDSEALTLETLSVSRQDSELALILDGRFGFADQQFMLGGEINALPLPLSGEPALRIPTGSLVASGTPANYQARLELGLSGEATGELQALIQASGDSETLILETLALSRDNSELTVALQGHFGFAEQRFVLDADINALPVPLTGEPALRIPSATLSANGTPSAYQAALGATLQGDLFGQLRADLAVQGDAEQLKIQQLELRQPDGNFVFGGQANLRLADLSFDSELDWQALQWPLVGQPQLISPEGEIRASGTPTDYQASLLAQLLGPENQPLSLGLDLSGSDQRIDISRLALETPGEGPSLDARAQVELQPLAFQASGDWASLVWPLQGEPQVQSPDGSFQAEGDLQSYTFELQTQVRGPTIPATRIGLKGQGDGESLESAKLRADLLGGSVVADLSARWAPALGWTAELRGEGLDIGSFNADFPGIVGFALGSQGQMQEDTLIAGVSIRSLDGSIREQALGGTGEISLQGEIITIQGLKLQAGEASVAIDGQVSEELSLDWQLAVRLEALVEDFRGRIQGQGRVAGSRTLPRVDADLTVNQLVAAGVVIDDLALDARVDLGSDKPSSLNLRVEGIQSAGQVIDSVRLEGDGTPANHRLSLNASTAAFGDLLLQLSGGLDEAQRWTGQLATLRLSDTPGGNWQLANAASLAASAEAASLGQVCLSQQPAQVCLSGDWSADAGANARISLDRLTAALAGEYLPDNLRIDTALGGEILASSDPAGAFEAQLDLRLDPGQLSTEVSGNTLEIPLGGGELQASANNQSAEASFTVDLQTLGNLALNATVADLSSRPRVDARIQATLQDLSMAEIVVPQLTDVTGRIEVDLTVNGSPPVLDLGGSLGLVDAGLEVPEINLQLRQLNLLASSVGSEILDLDGSVNSGQGSLRFGGQLEPLQGRVLLTIQGDRFQVINTEEIQAIASPNLEVNISPEAIRVSGEVTIPMAHISPPAVEESGIQPSDDVIIVRTRDGQTVAPESQAGAPIYARVKVILGDDVRVSAAGFEGKLEGDLEVEQRPGLTPRGSGSIAVASGMYRIAGQEINIERGRILFGGGPITQPGLDLRVAREKDGIVAGAQVSGPVSDPDLRFFSTPPMPDASILSYLMFGRAPDSRASGENAMLLSAVTGGSSLLTQRVGQQVGLDDLRVVGDGTDEASLLLGKYLTPQLWVGYGVGLLNAVNEFLVRYELTSNIYLEASTSEEGSGGDITYTIER